MTRVPNWVRFAVEASLRDWLRFSVRFLAIATIVGVIGLFAAIKYTERPVFCQSCHIMDPYYKGWQTSTHSQVPCIDCHYAPGLRSSFRGKLQGLSQVAKYFTGTEGTRPWAEIEDASCLRSGCHETSLLTGVVDFSGVKFDHTPHLKDLKRGKKLRCTSCHSQIVQGKHISVTPSPCILCHFKDQKPGEPVAGCRGCHEVPSDTILLPGGSQYNHRNYVDKGVDCVSCHATVTAGDGFVPKSRCFVCHNIPVDELLKDPDKLHRHHVTEHKVECTDCHEEMTHGYESKRRVAALDCRSCHENKHASTVRLAQGDIAELIGDSEPHVGPMLAARVECISCHTKKIGSDPAHRGTTRVGNSAACASCHGQSSVKILGQWKQFFARRIPEVEGLVGKAKLDPTSRAKAREMIATVKTGGVVHNPSLARDLLDAAARIARGEPARIARPVAERVNGEGLDCGYCHLEAPRGEINFQGKGTKFRHEVHTKKLGIGCTKCHASAPSAFPSGGHGKATISTKDCASCHHRQSRNCSPCHGDGPENSLEFRGTKFAHTIHIPLGVECADCHGDDTSPIAVGDPCSTCHSDGLPEASE